MLRVLRIPVCVLATVGLTHLGFVIVGLSRPEDGPRACLHVFGQLSKDGTFADGSFELENGITARGGFHMDRVLIGDVQ